jgi:enoyl-CoA hydratase
LSRAKEYLFLGARIPAEDAVRLGLASRIVVPEELLDEALALARKLAEVPAAALQDTKRALNSYLEAQLEHAFAGGLSGELASMGSDEHRQAVAAARSKAANRSR